MARDPPGQLTRDWGSSAAGQAAGLRARENVPACAAYPPSALHASCMHPRRRKDVPCDGNPCGCARPGRPELALVPDGQRCPHWLPTHGPLVGSHVGVASSVPNLYPPVPVCVVCRDGFTARGFRLARLGPCYDAPAVRWDCSAAPVVSDGLRPVVRDHVIYHSLVHN